MAASLVGVADTWTALGGVAPRRVPDPSRQGGRTVHPGLGDLHADSLVEAQRTGPGVGGELEAGGPVLPRTGEGVTTPGDFTLDEKTQQVFLTEQGHETAERVLANAKLIAEGASLYDPANITLMHHLNAALRARHLYHRDQHYVVQQGEVVIVDEFTGRTF